MAGDRRPLLELDSVSKSYGDLIANDAVSLAVAPGEVVSMLGENGAGKSTLMKITYGLVRADSGRVRVEGRELDLRSPRDAMAAGIGMVTQEFSLVETMTVAENVALSGIGLGRVDRRRLRQEVMEVMDRVGVRIEPDRPVASLSIGERQRVEIVKALFHDCRVLILDEPTAVLTPQDVEALFATVRRLRANDLGVLFVSHKLREVAEISDRVVVLRHGKLVADRPMSQVTTRSLAALMMGVTASEPVIADAAESAALGVAEEDAARVGAVPRQDAPADDPAVVAARDGAADEVALEISRVGLVEGGATVLDELTLDVRPGEIVGLAGISGNGQSQLVDVLSGVRRPTSGTVRVAGVDVTTASVEDRLRAGLGRLTEDRRGSTFGAMSVEQNLVVEDLHAFRRMGLLDRRKVRRHAEELIDRFSIKARPTDLVSSLSGGNIQKVLLARALHRRPRALVAAQPTRGLDIGTYGYVHDQLRELRAHGAGVLLVSEDLDELRSLADRIAVIFRGRLVGELPAAEAGSERLGMMMTGSRAA